MTNAKILQESLPRALDPLTFAASRISEIQFMQGQMKAALSSKMKRLFQRLPKHLRRRAASYNPRRVPLSKRSSAEAEIAGCPTAPKEPKKLHRKTFRSRKAMLIEYKSRQSTSLWLETHIWHAKRMKMQPKWGFQLAVSPNQKTFRRNHTLPLVGACLYDASYWMCYLVDVEGSADFFSVYCGIPKIAENSSYSGDFCDSSAALCPFRMIFHQGQCLLFLHPAGRGEFTPLLAGFSFLHPATELQSTFEVFGKNAATVLQKLFPSFDERLETQATATENASVLIAKGGKTPVPWFLLRTATAGTGRSLWRKLIYARAVAFSLQDMQNFYHDFNILSFPEERPEFAVPFSNSHREESSKRLASWQARPPAKRLNFQKLSVEHPFSLEFLPFSAALSTAVFMECTGRGMPEWNARIYLEGQTESPVGAVIQGNYSLSCGSGKCVALISREHSGVSRFLCRNLSAVSSFFPLVNRGFSIFGNVS